MQELTDRLKSDWAEEDEREYRVTGDRAMCGTMFANICHLGLWDGTRAANAGFDTYQAFSIDL